MEAVSCHFLSPNSSLTIFWPGSLSIIFFVFFFSQTGSSCDEDRRGGPHQRVAEQNPGERQNVRRKASGRAEGKHGSHGATLRRQWSISPAFRSTERKNPPLYVLSVFSHTHMRFGPTSVLVLPVLTG